MSDNRKWVPEIMYEEYEEDSLSGGLPFIQVPVDKEMPDIVFLFGSQETGEFEPGTDGEQLPIVEMDLHQYADMLTLKNNLDEETYDKVRKCLGLEPLRSAATAGKKITDNIRKNIKERSWQTA